MRDDREGAALGHLLQIRRQRHNQNLLCKRAARRHAASERKMRLFYPSERVRQSLFTQQLLQFA
ncbi:hypothetical protein BN134_617 [Cronobacter dublinensis 1210]|uniref:Uncharacterized protein n=1 Tax=Cronobacter dublinensis 1210 TaxID=1208656 RepID=A0ABM9Q3F7_9ENTR|nr:hypothetical protein BN134_617 [Cronobacter dublinensis 1210]